jgi:hypothetical protein
MFGRTSMTKILFLVPVPTLKWLIFINERRNLKQSTKVGMEWAYWSKLEGLQISNGNFKAKLALVILPAYMATHLDQRSNRWMMMKGLADRVSTSPVNHLFNRSLKKARNLDVEGHN